VDPKYASKLEELERRLVAQPGELDPAVRRAVAAGEDPPSDAAGYVDKVRRRAYSVTNGDVDDLLAAGWSEDQVFELTVVAAYGAARRRLDAGLRALGAEEPTATLGGEAS
jgi:hypothetical protein